MQIVIRMARKGDGKAAVECWNAGVAAGFRKYTGSIGLRTYKDAKRWDKFYADGKKGGFVFVALDKNNGKIVGLVSFGAKEKGRSRHRGELGWSVHPDYARIGIATKLVKRVLVEARKRGFKRAEAEAAAENLSSVKLAKKCGFKIEGKRKAGLLLDDGRYVDSYLFGKILR